MQTKGTIKKRQSDASGMLTKAQADSTTSADGHPVHSANKKWAIGDQVLCRYMHAENIYYEAKVTALKEKDGEQAYAIHYPGWSTRHDEVVPHSQALLRFKDYTKEDADKAKIEIKKARESTKKRKSDKRFDDSRSDTPGGDASSGKRKPGMNRRLLGAAEMPDRRKDLPQVVLGDELRRILIDDENLINKSCFLPKLPARVTIFDIIKKYRDTLAGGNASPHENYIEQSGNTNNPLLNPTSENLQRSALGILDYFEAAIGTILLYKFERPMFNELHEKLEKQKLEEMENESEEAGKSSEDQQLDSKRISFAKQFGLPHLLRMFVRFTEMLSYTEWSDRALEAIIRHAQDFVMFLNKNHQEYFNVDEDYILASADYHKRVWGNQS